MLALEIKCTSRLQFVGLGPDGRVLNITSTMNNYLGNKFTKFGGVQSVEFVKMENW